MKKDLILVIGSSGSVGSEIVRQLKAEGHAVRQTTSKTVTSSDTVHLDMLTGEGLREAFEGVDRAFFLSPPPHVDQYKMLSPLIQEAKRRGLKKVVLMTAMGANAVETSPFRRAEIELEKSGLNYNIIRPNWFMQNFNSYWIHGIKEQNQIALAAGDAKTSFIDTRDISAVAAKLLTSDKWNNKDFDLTGADSITHAEVADEISKATGKKVAYHDIAPEEFRKGLLSAGLPVDYVDFMLMIMGFLREGYNARVTDCVSQILGRAPIGFKNYVQDYKKSWA